MVQYAPFYPDGWKKDVNELRCWSTCSNKLSVLRHLPGVNKIMDIQLSHFLLRVISMRIIKRLSAYHYCNSTKVCGPLRQIAIFCHCHSLFSLHFFCARAFYGPQDGQFSLSNRNCSWPCPTLIRSRKRRTSDNLYLLRGSVQSSNVSSMSTRLAQGWPHPL